MVWAFPWRAHAWVPATTPRSPTALTIVPSPTRNSSISQLNMIANSAHPARGQKIEPRPISFFLALESSGLDESGRVAARRIHAQEVLRSLCQLFLKDLARLFKSRGNDQRNNNPE